MPCSELMNDLELHIQKMAFIKASSIISAAPAKEGVRSLVCRFSFHSTGNCKATVIDGIGKNDAAGRKRKKKKSSVLVTCGRKVLS